MSNIIENRDCFFFAIPHILILVVLYQIIMIYGFVATVKVAK